MSSRKQNRLSESSLGKRMPRPADPSGAPAGTARRFFERDWFHILLAVALGVTAGSEAYRQGYLSLEQAVAVMIPVIALLYVIPLLFHCPPRRRTGIIVGGGVAFAVAYVGINFIFSLTQRAAVVHLIKSEPQFIGAKQFEIDGAFTENAARYESTRDSSWRGRGAIGAKYRSLNRHGREYRHQDIEIEYQTPNVMVASSHTSAREANQAWSTPTRGEVWRVRRELGIWKIEQFICDIPIEQLHAEMSRVRSEVEKQ